jgi:hypothetical protein
VTGWREVAIGFSSDEIRIGGINVWAEEWRPIKIAPVMLPHPAYLKQFHSYQIYEIGDAEHPIRFAASELSNNVWGFYVPDGS